MCVHPWTPSGPLWVATKTKLFPDGLPLSAHDGLCPSFEFIVNSLPSFVSLVLFLRNLVSCKTEFPVRCSVAYACDLSTWAAEAGGLVGYRVTQCQAKKGWGGDAVGEHSSQIQNVWGSNPRH